MKIRNVNPNFHYLTPDIHIGGVEGDATKDHPDTATEI